MYLKYPAQRLAQSENLVKTSWILLGQRKGEGSDAIFKFLSPAFIRN